MKKNFCFIFAFILLFCFVASVGYSKTPEEKLEEKYASRWEKTYIGMPLDEFRKVWPEAKRSGSGLSGETIWYFFIKSFGKIYSEYFGFKDDKLINYSGDLKNSS